MKYALFTLSKANVSTISISEVGKSHQSNLDRQKAPQTKGNIQLDFGVTEL